ncbi:MAG: PAS domain-containing protein, partial [Thermoplasmatota archaeon]
MIIIHLILRGLIEINNLSFESVQNVLKCNPYGILILEDERILYINKKVEDMFGVGKDEIIEKGFDFLEKIIGIESEEVSDLKEIIDDVKNNSKSKSNLRISILENDKKKYFDLDIVHILDEEDNRLKIVLYFGSEINKKSDDIWSMIHEVIGHPILILDKDQKILDINNSAKELLGKSIDEIKDIHCCELFHKSDEPPEDCPFLKIIESKKMETEEMEVEVLGKYFLVSCTPILDDQGEIDSVIHICTDITEEK